MYISILSDYPCLEVVYGTVRRRRRRGCRRWCRSDLICPAGWLSARLDVRTYVRGTLGVVCLLRCCAALCCVLLLRCCVVSYGCVRVLTHRRESRVVRVVVLVACAAAIRWWWLVGVASKRQVRWGLVSLFYKSSLRLNVGNIHGTSPSFVFDTRTSPQPTNRSKRSDGSRCQAKGKKENKNNTKSTDACVQQCCRQTVP